MKKGQMSLEMIIGLLILLVVATVVIRIFLKSITKTEDTGFENTIKWKNFQSKCESLCNEYKGSGSRGTLAKYCYTQMSGNTDLNDNGVVDELDSSTKILPICEDMIYCFHVYECETDYGIIDWGDCRDTVCESVEKDYDIHRDAQLDAKVKEDYFPGVGSCELKNEDDNWWNMYFGGAPCSSPPNVRFIGNCIVTGSGPYSFSCEDAAGLSNCDVGGIAISDSNGNSAVANYGGTTPKGSINFDDGLYGKAVLDGGTPLGDCDKLEFYCINPDDLENPILYSESSNSCQLGTTSTT